MFVAFNWIQWHPQGKLVPHSDSEKLLNVISISTYPDQIVDTNVEAQGSVCADKVRTISISYVASTSTECIQVNIGFENEATSQINSV